MADREAKAAKADARKWRQHISRMGGAKWQAHGEWDLLAGIAITELGLAEAALVEARRVKKTAAMEWGVEGVKRRQKETRARAAARAEEEIELLARMQSRAAADDENENESGEDEDDNEDRDKDEAMEQAHEWEEAEERVRKKHADAAAAEVSGLRQRAKSESQKAKVGLDQAVARHRAAAAAAAADVAAGEGRNPKGTKEERHTAATVAAMREVEELQKRARELRVRAEVIGATILQRQQRRRMGAARVAEIRAVEAERIGAASCIQRRVRGGAVRTKLRAQWVMEIKKRRAAVQEARPASAAGPATPTARAIALATAAAKTAIAKARVLMHGRCAIEELFDCLDNEMPDLRQAPFAFACGYWDRGDGGSSSSQTGGRNGGGGSGNSAFRVRIQPTFRGGSGSEGQLCAFIALRSAVESLHTDAIVGRLWAQPKRCLQQQSTDEHYNRVRRAIEQRGGGLCDAWEMGTFLFRRFAPPPSSGVYRIPLTACTATAITAAATANIPRGLKTTRASGQPPFKTAVSALDLSLSVAETAVRFPPLTLPGVRESGWRGAADQSNTEQGEGEGRKWRSMLRWGGKGGKDDKGEKGGAQTPRARAKSITDKSSADGVADVSTSGTASAQHGARGRRMAGHGRSKKGKDRPRSCPPCIRQGYELHGLVDRSIVEVALDKVAQRVETDGELERMTKLRSKFSNSSGTTAVRVHAMADGACGDTRRQYVELPWCRCQNSCEPGARKRVSCMCCECFRALCHTCHREEHVGEYGDRGHTTCLLAPIVRHQ
jgi:hypothetical protein